MSQEIKTKFHNRFDIYQTNIQTGETRQIAFAENIVLDAIWTRLVNRQTYFANIHYGTGTGSLASTRTSLFTHLGTKTASDDVLSRTLPTASWRRKIVLNPEDNIGAVLTEIGIAYDATSSHLMTHAMLRDMNGNIVAITKTAVDVLTIYATVYVTFSTSDTNLQICGLPNANPLMNYLIGGSSIGSCYFYTGAIVSTTTDDADTAVLSDVLGTTAAITWTADVANKKMTTSTPRFAVGDSNGHVAEVGFGTAQANPIFRLKLPAANIYAGLPLSGVSVGSGDGVTTRFKLPSRNVAQESIEMKVDDTVSTDYTKVVVPIPTRNATGFGRSGEWSVQKPILSGDGKMVVQCQRWAVSDYSEPVSYALSQNGVLKSSISWSDSGNYQYPAAKPGALSDDGKILVLTPNAAKILSYDLVSGAWVARPDPASLPTGACSSCALSADGGILAVSHATTPFVTTYDWTDGAWVKRANPASLPTGNATSVSLSENGLVMIVTHNTSPFVTTYDWTAGAWVKRADPASLPASVPTCCALSGNGSVMALTLGASPYILSYDWTGTEWVQRTAPTTLPTGGTINCSLSQDGTVLGVGHYNSPYMTIYKWVASTWDKMSNPDSMPIDFTNVQISKNGKFCIVAHVDPQINGTTTLTRVYSLEAYETQIQFNTAPVSGAVITASYTVNGLHKTAQRVIDLNATITFGEPI